ncbi:coatomer subunit zeta-3-like protein [Trifolium pratense]|uniref:Coatomer subunit zeta n=1 Tax=Trifolium pratense TaxID=57577 RepID=A0A2K3N4A2_TRIPR|nr:coatomer subunit zeta-3-like protein [Trifolium pratense]
MLHVLRDMIEEGAITISVEVSCPSIKNILLLDSEGKRVAVKYFSDDWPTNSSKLAFEKFVFTKTLKTNARTEGIYPQKVPF